MSKGNVIDISTHLKKRGKSNKQEDGKAQVLDMVERRQAAITEERRSMKRTILTEFIGFKVVIPERGLLDDVSLYDVSSKGLAFEHEAKLNGLSVGSEIAARIYLTQNSYFPFTLKITNIRFQQDEGVYRYGSVLLKEDHNKEALGFFIKFIESVSPSLRNDKGDLVTRIFR